MTHEEEYELYKQVIEKNGVAAQMIVAVEELSELQKEICKFLRDKGNLDHLAEEFVDVEITMSELLVIFRSQNIFPLLDTWRGYKLDRLAKSVKKKGTKK